MDPETKAARAASFGGVAEAYERIRPSYPVEAVRWLTGPTPCDVLDLGAGTGKLTRVLAELGHRPVAVDPSPEMLDQLRASLPLVAAHVGNAEAIPLPDATVDVVTVAQAFHWFDPARALPEIARVLRPAGLLALVWNVRDDTVPWVSDLTGIIDSANNDHEEVSAVIAASGRFGPVEHQTFRQEVRHDRASLCALVSTRSYCATKTPEDRARVLAEVGRLYDDNAGPEGIVLPYRTECFRSRRR